MNRLPPPSPQRVARIAPDSLSRSHSLPPAYENRGVPEGPDGPGGAIQLPPPPPGHAPAYVAPKLLYPPVPPPVLPSLPPPQGPNGVGVPGERLRLSLPPPPGIPHVAPEPRPPPILPSPLLSLPPYKGQRIPGGPGGTASLLDIDDSPWLRKWKVSNRHGRLWGYPIPGNFSAEEWRRLHVARNNVSQALQLVAARITDPSPQSISISSLLNPVLDAPTQAANHVTRAESSNTAAAHRQETVQVVTAQRRGRNRNSLDNILNPARDAPAHGGNRIPYAESSSAAAARPREALSEQTPILPPHGPHVNRAADALLYQDDSDHDTLYREPTPPIRSRFNSSNPDSSIPTTAPRNNGPRSQSEPVVHSDRHDISPNLPSRSFSFPAIPSHEDLSDLPLRIADKLIYSAQLSLSATCASTSGPQYELVQEEYLPQQAAPMNTKVDGPFMSRHTANFEAAKMFVHRFWKEVMVEMRAFDVHLGEVGILTMLIRLEDGKGGKKETSVFVRRKGMPGPGPGPEAGAVMQP